MNKSIRLFHFLEDALLYLITAGLIGLAILQIWLRNVHDSGIYWGDSALRVFVFWLAMVGAMVASRESGHISIDAFTHYLRPAQRRMLGVLTSLFSAFICLLAAWYCLAFVLDEREYGDIAFAQVPVWICEAIIPVALATMGLRFLIQIFVPLPETKS
ncbi:MAG: TRAP transporter small permease subunit [Pseudomonadales bacterium]